MNDKYWRVLVRITKVSEDQVSLTIPAWNHRRSMMRTIDEVPGSVTLIGVGETVRMHALANIGIDPDGPEPGIKDWEEK